MDVAAGGPVKELSDAVTCSFCLEYFKDPVIIKGCGHSFCRACLTQCWLTQYASCPQCSEKVQPVNLRENWQLAKVVEIAKKFREETGAKRKRAECERHREPLKLFCRDDQAPICVMCNSSKEHGDHSVLPMEEAFEEYKEEVQGQLKSLGKEREKAVNQKLAEEQRIQKWLAELAVEKQTFTTAFEQVQNFLEEKKRFWLSQLVVLEKEMENRRGGNVNKLSEEISRLSGLIKEREEKCHQPASEFLQDIRSTLSRYRYQEGQLLLDISPNLEERLRSYSQKNSALKEIMEKFEGSLSLALNKGAWMSGGGANAKVTLDPETAHPLLVVSEDLKSVRNGGGK